MSREVSPGLRPEVRFAKHRLLPEIGPRGQERLSAARYTIDPQDPAARFAAELLDRSGLQRDPEGDRVTPAAALTSDPAFEEVDVALRGALVATQRIREIVGLPSASLALHAPYDRRAR